MRTGLSRPPGRLLRDVGWGIAVSVNFIFFALAVTVPALWLLTDHVESADDALSAILVGLLGGVWAGVVVGTLRPLATRDLDGAFLGGAFGGAVFYVVPWTVAAPIIDLPLLGWIGCTILVGFMGALFGSFLAAGLWVLLGRRGS